MCKQKASTLTLLYINFIMNDFFSSMRALEYLCDNNLPKLVDCPSSGVLFALIDHHRMIHRCEVRSSEQVFNK